MSRRSWTEFQQNCQARSSVDTEQSLGKGRDGQVSRKRLPEEQSSSNECDDHILSELRKIDSHLGSIESRVSKLESEHSRSSLPQLAKKRQTAEHRGVPMD